MLDWLNSQSQIVHLITSFDDTFECVHCKDFDLYLLHKSYRLNFKVTTKNINKIMIVKSFVVVDTFLCWWLKPKFTGTLITMLKWKRQVIQDFSILLLATVCENVAKLVIDCFCQGLNGSLGCYLQPAFVFSVDIQKICGVLQWTRGLEAECCSCVIHAGKFHRKENFISVWFIHVT